MADTAPAPAAAPKQKVHKTEAEWRGLLTPEQFHIMRQKGTEPAFTGALVDNHDDGIYHCAACNAPLFTSDKKFDSGSGWPSFAARVFRPYSVVSLQIEKEPATTRPGAPYALHPAKGP